MILSGSNLRLFFIGKLKMEIYLNGELKSVADNLTISNLIEDLSLENKRFAVEVNLDIIPRSQFEQFKLKNQDKVEIVQAIGGG